jgi:hypothetical protein
MAVSFITTIGTTDYGFDWVNKVIEIESAVLEITAADLKEAIHDAQDGTEGVTFDQIAENGNPVVLTPTTSTFLNVILLSTWKILSLSVTGTFTVGSGNVVSKADGIDIFAPNVLVTLVNNTSAAGVLVVTGGSALLPAEATALAEIYTRLGLDVTDPITDATAGIDSASGDIEITRTGDGTTTSTLTRQP